MDDKDKVTERRGLLQLIASALAVVLVYCIGQQNADSATFFSLAGALLLLGIPLGCMTWPPSETGQYVTPLRAFLAGFATAVVIVVTTVVSHLFPDQSYVPSIIVGAGLLLIMHVQAP